MSLFKSVKVINSGKAILLSRKNKTPLRYHSTWLRDNALDSKTRDKKNGQRLISISDIPVTTYIKSASLSKKGKEIIINFLPKKKQVKFTSSWLEKHAYDKKERNSKVWINPDLNPYRNPVPTIQILHCLKNSTKGGDSKVVDGFNAALRLKKVNKRYFNLLSKYCSRFEFKRKKNAHLKSRFPMIALSPDGELTAVHFNNRSIAPITDVPYNDMTNYYKAYRKFSSIIDDPAMALTFKLNPGECFILDNTRVLHARTGYSGKGSRWLQGCYVDKDGLLSTILTL